MKPKIWTAKIDSSSPKPHLCSKKFYNNNSGLYKCQGNSGDIISISLEVSAKIKECFPEIVVATLL